MRKGTRSYHKISVQIVIFITLISHFSVENTFFVTKIELLLMRIIKRTGSENRISKDLDCGVLQAVEPVDVLEIEMNVRMMCKTKFSIFE